MQLQQHIRYLEQFNQQSYSTIQSLKDVSMSYTTFIRKIQFQKAIRHEQQEKFQIFQSKALRSMILSYYGAAVQKSQEEIKFINYLLGELELLNEQIDQATSMWRKQQLISQQISMTMEGKIRYLGQRLKKNNDKLTQLKKQEFMSNIKTTYEGQQPLKKQQIISEQDANNIILNQDLLKTMQLKLFFEQNELNIRDKIEKQIEILRLKISRFQHLFILKSKEHQQKSHHFINQFQQNPEQKPKQVIHNQYYRKMTKEQVAFSGKPIRNRKPSSKSYQQKHQEQKIIKIKQKIPNQ